MRIDSLSASADRAGRYWVKFSDGSKLRMYPQTVEDFGLYTGLELTQEQMTALQEAAGQMSAKMRAVRVLSASNVSKADLQQRLIQKGESKHHAARAVEWMEQLDLVDDGKTAQLLVQRCAAKGYGVARAKQVLYEKRIPKELWEEALQDYPDQTQHILDFLRTRLGGNREAREVKRVTNALLRKGHSYSEIRWAMEQLGADTDSFPEEY